MVWEGDTSDRIAWSLYENFFWWGGAEEMNSVSGKLCIWEQLKRSFSVVGKDMFLFMIVTVVTMLSLGCPCAWNCILLSAVTW
jgi:hypothetical protein